MCSTPKSPTSQFADSPQFKSTIQRAGPVLAELPAVLRSEPLMLRSGLVQSPRCPVRFTLNGKDTDGLLRARDAPARGPARGVRHRFGQERVCARGRLRLLPGADRRHPGAVVPEAARSRPKAATIVTLEGLPEDMRKRMGDAFVLEGGVQCGFCIPGIVVRASTLVQQGKTERPRGRSPRRSTGICAAAPGTGESSTRFRPRAKRQRAAIGLTRSEPRTASCSSANSSD